MSSDAVTVASGELADALRQVVRAASGDEARPILTGVLLAATADGVQLVATDSYRLAVRDLPGLHVVRGEQKVLIPSRALAELQRVLGGAPEASVRLGTTEASFDVGSVKLTTRLIEGEFPNVLNLVPASYPNKLTVSREALLDAVKRVKLLVRDQTTPVRMSLRADGVEVTVTNPAEGTATEDVEAKYEGVDMTVAFNPQYLTDGHRGHPRRRAHARNHRRAEGGHHARRRRRELPVPAHACAGAVSRRDRNARQLARASRTSGATKSARLDLAPDGLTVVVGENGQGKTNLLEAMGWLATLVVVSRCAQRRARPPRRDGRVRARRGRPRRPPADARG